MKSIRHEEHVSSAGFLIENVALHPNLKSYPMSDLISITIAISLKNRAGATYRQSRQLSRASGFEEGPP